MRPNSVRVQRVQPSENKGEIEMTNEISVNLDEMTVKQLQSLALEVCGESYRSNNKLFLKKKVAAALAEQPCSQPAKKTKSRDPRLPSPGTVLRREHKGTIHEVTVLEQGFEYQGEHYSSLSKLAKQITGSIWNGYGFFRLLEHQSRKSV